MVFFLHFLSLSFFFFFFNDTATTEIYTLSLHDALPISPVPTHRDRPMSAPLCPGFWRDRKSTRLNSSHITISYAVFCLKKKKKKITNSFISKRKKHKKTKEKKRQTA